MMLFRRCFAPIVLFSVLIMICACSPDTPPPQIDGDLAFRLAEEHVKLGKRHSGSSGAEKAAEWIADQCKEVHPDAVVTLHEFEEKTVTGNVRFRNLIAEIPGKTKDFVVIAAHYDTKFFPEGYSFDGANDGASGVAALLAMMKSLHGVTPPVGIRFVFFDGEECRYSYGKMDGLHGSRKLVADWRESGELKRCRAMILLDMIGDKELCITLSQDTRKTMATLARNAAKTLQLTGYITDHRGDILDDHVPFQDAGIPAIDLIDFSYGPENSYWHTSEDSIDKISGRSMKIAADLAFRMIWDIAEGTPL